jgi:phosphatidylserine/phosphatidylglycerophosphate/cardiolipin synthase-like enzyme
VGLSLLLGGVSCPLHGQAASLVLRDAPVRVYFSPKGGATQAVVEAIGAAKQTIVVQAYSFTSAPIAKALKDAYLRGVHVMVVLDKSQRSERYSSATFLARAGIETFIDSQHAIQHSKVMVIDQETVITGSFNFTKAAESSNSENLLILGDRALALAYRQEWERHLAHSERYQAR